MLSDPEVEASVVGYLLRNPTEARALRRILSAHALATPWLRKCYQSLDCRALTIWQIEALLTGAAAGPECARSFARYLAGLYVKRQRYYHTEARLLRAQVRLIGLAEAGLPLGQAAAAYSAALSERK